MTGDEASGNRAERLIAIAVGLGWLTLVSAAVGFVLRFGTNAPYADEWDLTQPLLGTVAPLDWIFGRLNEHRYPLANLLYLVTLRVSGFDFRAAMFLSVVVLALAGVLILLAIRHLRGKPRLGDLLFPVLLLHWGHWYNLLMGFQLAFALWVLGMALVMLIVCRAEPGRELRSGISGGLALLMLMLNGLMGVIVAPFIGGWLGYLALRVWRNGSASAALLMLVAPVLAALYCLESVLGLPAVAGPSPPHHIPTSFLAFLQYLGIALGPWVKSWDSVTAGIVVGSVELFAFAVLVRMILVRPTERPRALGLLAVLLAHLALGLAIAWSRACGDVDRYALLSSVGLLVTGLTAIAYGPGINSRGFSLLGLVIAWCVFAINAGIGTQAGLTMRMHYREFEKDMARGMPAYFLAGKYAGPFLAGPRMAENLERMRRHRMGRFATIAVMPRHEIIAVPLNYPVVIPSSLGNPAPESLRIVLPDPPTGRKVLGVEMEFSLDQPAIWLVFLLHGSGAESPAQVYAPLMPGRHVVRFWVDENAGPMMIEPACPTFGIVVHRLSWVLVRKDKP